MNHSSIDIVETGHLSLTKHPLFHPVDLGKKLYSQNKIVWINARMVHISGLTLTVFVSVIFDILMMKVCIAPHSKHSSCHGFIYISNYLMKF
jgi:hypothetical protein